MADAVVPFEVCLYCHADIFVMFLSAIHVGEGYSQILLGFS